LLTLRYGGVELLEKLRRAGLFDLPWLTQLGGARGRMSNAILETFVAMQFALRVFVL
jgi:hypothetical protein